MATPLRNVRIPDDEWSALLAAATENGTTATEVLRAAARRYVTRHKSAVDA